MPSDIVRRSSGDITRREQRQLAAHLQQAQVPAQVAGARIESAAFATHVALSNAAMLSAAEARALAMAPIGEARYRAIVDAFAGYACSELTLLVTK